MNSRREKGRTGYSAEMLHDTLRIETLAHLVKDRYAPFRKSAGNHFTVQLSDLETRIRLDMRRCRTRPAWENRVPNLIPLLLQRGPTTPSTVLDCDFGYPVPCGRHLTPQALSALGMLVFLVLTRECFPTVWAVKLGMDPINMLSNVWNAGELAA